MGDNGADYNGVNGTEVVKREQWGSGFAFVLAAAGSAVGLGNIWRFPYVVGENGGAAFVFVYLLIIAAVGYPMLITEMTLGQKTRKNPVGAFKALAPGTPWWIIGALGVLAGFVILSFYSVVAGWAISYFFKTMAGQLQAGTDFSAAFANHVSSPIAPLLWHAVFMVITIAVIAAGVVKGIEKTVKYLMPVLFILLIFLAGRALTLPGSAEGLAYYLKPDFSALSWEVLLCAVGQSFFTLSLGMGAILTYGSYMDRRQNIADNAAWVAGLDVLVALIAGLAIFPAVFALGFDPAAGGGLAFITLPAVFAAMPLGMFFGSLFFALLIVAAVTSAISLLEVVVSWLVDEYGWKRFNAALLSGLLIFLLGVPASLSEGIMSEFTFLGMNFFGFLDFLQESILLPLGGLLIAIFSGYIWTAGKVREEASRNRANIQLGIWFDVLLKYVVPLSIIIVMVMGLIEQFG